MIKDDSIFESSVKESLWECPVWHQKTPFTEEFNKELLKELYEIAYNFNEFTGKDSLLQYDRPCLKELIEYKTKVITEVVNEYMPEGQKAEFVAKVIPKSEDQREKIHGKMMQSFLFNSLEDKDLETVINAMEEKHYKVGELHARNSKIRGVRIYSIK